MLFWRSKDISRSVPNKRVSYWSRTPCIAKTSEILRNVLFPSSGLNMEAVFATWYLRTIVCAALEPENPKSTCSKNCTPLGQFLLFRSRVTAQDALGLGASFSAPTYCSEFVHFPPLSARDLQWRALKSVAFAEVRPHETILLH